MLIPENDHDWVHQNYVCYLAKEADSVISLYNIFCRFRNFPPDFYQRNWDRRSCACYKVYWEDKLSDNWNLYEKESTRSKLTLYIPSVENMVAYILWWVAIIFMSKLFVKLKQISYDWCTLWGTPVIGLMVLYLGKANISIQCCCL